MENLVELVLHPIRMRLFMALAGREMTTQQLAETLGDVPPATLYRHLNLLTKSGVISLVTERRVRGTVEKIYTLNRQEIHLSEQEFSALSREDLMRSFTTFVATLLDDFSRYVKNAENLNLLTDGVGFQKISLELSDEEFTAFSQAINAVIIPQQNNQPSPKRKRRIFATIVMPDFKGSLPSGQPAPDTGGAQGKSNKENEC